MSKVVILDVNQLIDSSINERAESVFSDMMNVVEKHGVCYFRFTLEDGIVIVKPEYNAKINGVIADA